MPVSNFHMPRCSNLFGPSPSCSQGSSGPTAHGCPKDSCPRASARDHTNCQYVRFVVFSEIFYGYPRGNCCPCLFPPMPLVSVRVTQDFLLQPPQMFMAWHKGCQLSQTAWSPRSCNCCSNLRAAFHTCPCLCNGLCQNHYPLMA